MCKILQLIVSKRHDLLQFGHPFMKIILEKNENYLFRCIANSTDLQTLLKKSKNLSLNIHTIKTKSHRLYDMIESIIQSARFQKVSPILLQN